MNSKRFNTKAIVLGRTNFGEAARILTLLTPDQGKLRAMARGVRKSKSKLAGGIELFSVSDVTLMAGRGDINTLMSARLDKHYGNIVKDLDRTSAAYDFIKVLDKLTEENTEPAYFNLLKGAFQALDDDSLNLELIRLWFDAQLLKLTGQTPNLFTDQAGAKLSLAKTYVFDFDAMAFNLAHHGGRHNFGANQIKFLRLVFENHSLASLNAIEGSADLAQRCLPLVQSMLSNYIPI